MANHLQLMNESFDKIIIKETSPVLFEEFCEECSESGVSKEDILDWLYQHEQLVQDCEEHFGQDASWASADELEAFISDHDTAWKDYAEHFDLEIQEDEDSLEESWTKMMFDFKHDGKYDEEALKEVIDKELTRQGLDWTGYVDFDAVDYSNYELDESKETTGLYKITPQEQEAFDSLDDETLRQIKLVIRIDVSYTGTREAMIRSVLMNLHDWGTSYSDETLRNATEYILKKGKYHSRYPYSMRYKNDSLKNQKHESLDSDLSEYQKWVDYDMKKYHRISDITMKKIKKAGLSVVKDQYGEYEVIADRPIKK